MPRTRTGFKIDASGIRRKLAEAKAEIQAEHFRPELMDFTRKSLGTASRLTPVRNYQLIRRNQSKQYNRRINYIPTAHTLTDPALRVNDSDHWLYSGGRWYNASRWNLAPNQWAQYQALNQERERRIQTTRAAFIKERAQARFLYRKSWSQVAESLGLSISVPGSVKASHSRHNPPTEPHRAFGQIRGGKLVLSVVVFNPLLEEPSRYKNWTGREIIDRAMTQHDPQFQRRFSSKLKRTLFAIMRRGTP